MCKVTVILCSAKRNWCYPWCTTCCPLRHLLGTSHKFLLSGHAVGMSHHLGALDSRAQHAPSSCWGLVIHSNWEQLLTTLLHMFLGGYVNTSFHVSKAKVKDRVMVTACLYIISWECVNVITCVMSPVPHQYDVCSLAPNVLQYPMWVSLCFFNTPVSIFLVAYWHTVTRATSPSPFLSIKLLLACCCTKNSLHVLDPNSCATGASQMFPHSLNLFFLLSFLEQNFWIIIKFNVLSHFHQWAVPST